MVSFSFIIFFGCLILMLFIGFLTGIFGVGGGFLMTPALMIFFGVPANIAVGTGLATILVMSGLGLFKRRGSNTIDIKLAAFLAGGSIFGVIIGTKIMELMKNTSPLMIMGKEQNVLQYITLCMFLMLLFLIAIFMFFDFRYKKTLEKEIGLISKIKIPPQVFFQSVKAHSISLIPLIAIGFAIGILTGLMGIGGGVVLLPVLIYLIGQKAIQATGTSLLVVWISSLTGVISHFLDKNINPLLLIGMIIGGLAGTYLGTHIGLKLADHKIKFYFIFVALAAVLIILVKLYCVTFG